MASYRPLIIIDGRVAKLQDDDFLYVPDALGIGVAEPTALLHLAPGTSAASTAPIKLMSGDLNSTAEIGAVEFLSDKLYFTITTGVARKEIALTEGLTSGRIPYATTNGRLTDDADLTFNGSLLSTTSFQIATTTGATVGVVKQGANIIFHTYHESGDTDNNLFVGVDSGNFTLTSTDNVCVGAATGFSLTSGWKNTLLGTNAGRNLTSGSENACVGGNSGVAITTGGRNFALGGEALRRLTTGSYNTGIGFQAGSGLVSAIFSTAIGPQAAYEATGSYCVFIGYGAGSHETGSNRFFIDAIVRASESEGRTKSLIYGIFNVDVASQYLALNAGNMAIAGILTMPDTTSSTLGVIYLGNYRFAHAFTATTTVGINTFAGKNSGNFTMSRGEGPDYSCSYQTGFGYGTLSSTTTGYGNTAVGASAGAAITSGSNNSLVGMWCGNLCTEGSSNVGFGRNTLQYVVTGSGNVAVGSGAGRYVTGSYSVFVGFSAGYYETGSDKLFIDNTNRANEADGRIKALVYGVFAADPVDQDFIVNGQVGVNITPTAWLTLRAGLTSAGTAPLKFTSGSLNTTAEAGAMEFLTDDLYFTITTSAARKKVALTEGLTSGRVPFATTNGRLTDDANLTFDGTYLQASGYKSSDGTVGATADVDVAKVGSGTRTLHFKNGLYTGYTDS